MALAKLSKASLLNPKPCKDKITARGDGTGQLLRAEPAERAGSEKRAEEREEKEAPERDTGKLVTGEADGAELDEKEFGEAERAAV